MDLKNKLELHGRALKKDNVFSIVRMVIVMIVVAFIMKGDMDELVMLMMIGYVMIILSMTLKKHRKDKVYFNFAEGNPLYDELKAYGSPDEIVEAVNREYREGKVLYNALGKPNKTSPEVLITENYFVYMNKHSSIIPLDKVVCAYMYDKAILASPPDSFLPTYFKPIHLIITYGRGKEGYFLYSTLDYKKVLETLDKRLNCKVIYDRQMGTLYKTDYPAFLQMVKEAQNK